MNVANLRYQLDGEESVKRFLDRLYRARICCDHPIREELLERLTPELVRRWLFSSRAAVAIRLLDELPDRCLKEHVPELVERWFELPTSVAGCSLERLVDLAPAKTAELLVDAARRLDGPQEVVRLCTVARAACKLGKAGKPAVTVMLQRYLDSTGVYRMYWDGLFVAAAAQGIREAPNLVARGLVEMASYGPAAESLLEEVYLQLAPEVPFLGMLFDVEFRCMGYRFIDIPELLQKNAPIDTLDYLADTTGTARLQQVLALLEEPQQHRRLAVFASRLAGGLPSSAPVATRRLVYLFCLASAAACWSAPFYPVEAMEFRQILELLSVDLPVIPHLEQLMLELKKRCNTRHLAIVHRELGEARQYRGAVRIIELISRVNSPRSAGPLLDCLAEECCEEVAQAAMVALLRLGRKGMEYCREHWDELDDNQRARLSKTSGIGSWELGVGN